MTNEGPTTTGKDDWRDCRPPRRTDACDPTSWIDESHCRDVGLTAQLDYSKQHTEALAQARADYDKARTEYRERRHEAALKVQDMKHQAKHLIERIKCLIEQDRVVRCLDDAFGEVCGQLDCCEGPSGCCVEEVTFDVEAPEGARKLARRIARYQEQVAGAQECFATLVAEPAELIKRVDSAKLALDAILAALAQDAANVNLRKQYAAALVVQRDLGRIWNGFADSAGYVDCLCRALTTWSAGVDAVSRLVGAQAERECQRASAQAWCAQLVAAPVNEVLAVYDRLCAADRPCGEPEAGGGHPGGGHPGDCGCGRREHGGTGPEEQWTGE